MNTDLTLQLPNLPGTEIAGADYDDLAKGADFLGRLQLYTKGDAIDRGLIKPGHYGIQITTDEIEDLGDAIDVIPLARRPKAIDMSDKAAIITVYDEKSDEFKRIAEASATQNSGCMYGVSFLVFERSTGRFLELFFGTKSTRPEAKNVYPFLPKADPNDATKSIPPQPLTLKVRYIKKQFSWHVPVVSKCGTPFANVPPADKVVKEILKFINPKSDDVEVVKKEETPAGKGSGKGRKR